MTETYKDVIKSIEDKSKTYSNNQLTIALIAAVKNDDKSAVSLLLSKGADPNFMPQDGFWSAMQNAVENKNLSILKLLVQGGGDVSLSDAKGFTLLHLSIDIEADSAYQSDTTPTAEVTRFLLESGAKLDVKDQSGQTPLDLAEEYEHEEVVALLKKQ